jgi:hypothetical protein
MNKIEKMNHDINTYNQWDAFNLRGLSDLKHLVFKEIEAGENLDRCQVELEVINDLEMKLTTDQ